MLEFHLVALINFISRLTSECAGKTHTIRGGNDEETYGVLPRTLRLLFRKIDQVKSARGGRRSL
jgi:hypothetical protein